MGLTGIGLPGWAQDLLPTGVVSLPSVTVASCAKGLLGVWVGVALGVVAAACRRSRDEGLCLRDGFCLILIGEDLAGNGLLLDGHPPADAGRRIPCEVGREKDGRPPADLGRARARLAGLAGSG